ncbi:PHP domain-containing protein [soil metagenome]
MYKIDLHTHSTGSPDGGITTSQYKQVLEDGLLDYIAITDHNRVDMALRLNKELGERIIVGEEIMTSKGEIIGLFLQTIVPPNLTPIETVQRIRDQGGLVYVPHPFEIIRKGLRAADLEDIAELIDIMEVYNGRAILRDRSQQAAVWAKLNRVIGVASSDAHGVKGLGKTYTLAPEAPTRDNLLTLLTTSTSIASRPSLRELMYPKYHRLRQKSQRGKV